MGQCAAAGAGAGSNSIIIIIHIRIIIRLKFRQKTSPVYIRIFSSLLKKVGTSKNKKEKNATWGQEERLDGGMGKRFPILLLLLLKHNDTLIYFFCCF